MSYFDHRIAGILESIDKKLGRIADALEKSVERNVDLSGVMEKNIVEEPVVEEMDYDVTLKRFVEMSSADRGFILLPTDRITVDYSGIDEPGTVVLIIEYDRLNIIRRVTYDYINNKVLKEKLYER